MKFALAALQGAVFGILAMRLAGSESLRFMFYGAVAFPLLSMLLSARWPGLAVVLGLLLVGLWTGTFGVMAYGDPSLQTWQWIPAFAMLGLLFGAGANSYLFCGTETLEPQSGVANPGAPSPPPPHPNPEADPWAILGISSGAAPPEIQRAFRARMAEYHPDKVAMLGAELRELSEAKSKAITAAYAVLAGR